jgi:hypothetical protein
MASSDVKTEKDSNWLVCQKVTLTLTLNELVVGQSPAGKNMSMEAEDNVKTQ